jgi:hypothetical protein
MKNKLMDLNNHLFAQLESLADPDIKGEQLKEEMERAKSMVFVGKAIIDNGRLALDAQRAVGETVSSTKLPTMLVSQ